LIREDLVISSNRYIIIIIDPLGFEAGPHNGEERRVAATKYLAASPVGSLTRVRLSNSVRRAPALDDNLFRVPVSPAIRCMAPIKAYRSTDFRYREEEKFGTLAAIQLK